MGARGPAPTPTKLLEDRGSWRAKLNPNEPRPDMGVPRCPKSLPAGARVVWRRITRMLDAMGVLARCDGNALERYCRFFVRWRQCEAFIDANGMSFADTLTDAGIATEFAEYPQVRESHRLNVALTRLETHFGLTPSARSRLTVPARGEQETGPRLADFVG